MAVAAGLMTIASSLGAAGAPTGSRAAMLGLLTPFLSVATMILASRTRCISLLLRWAVWGVLLVFLHAGWRKVGSSWKWAGR